MLISLGSKRGVIIDTETTGLIANEALSLDKQPRIIEIALLEVDGDMNINGRYSMLVNPEQPLPPEVQKITGLSDKDLTGQSLFPDIVLELIDRILGKEFIIGHNLHFDLMMLVFELQRIGWEHRFPYPPMQIDTQPLSGSKKLEEWARGLGVEFDRQQHRALADVLLLRECLLRG